MLPRNSVQVSPWWPPVWSHQFSGLIASLVLPVLATWRITHVLWAEEGPWDLFVRLRRWAGARGTRLFECFYCLSLWVALPIALLVAPSIATFALDWFAFSGAAILLERVTAAAIPPPVAVWREETAPDAADE